MKSKGFTLIELMIVLAIMGILFAVAVPAYNCKVNGRCQPTRLVAQSFCEGGVLTNTNHRVILDNNGQSIACGQSAEAR